MPVLAGWLTGEQVPQEVIEQTLAAMGAVLGEHGGQVAQTVQPGAGLIAFSDTAYAMQRNDDPPVLDWVPDRRTLVYRRPLSGLHTLYYVEDWPAQGNLLFASEIKALFAVGVPRHLHLAALDALLRYGFIPAPWTAFKDVHVVPAGSILRWQRAKTVVNQSTDYHLDETLSLHTATDVLGQLQTLLDEASAGMLPPHEQLVALTSGGTSSALATLRAAQHITSDFTVATLGYTKSMAAKAWREAERIATTCKRPFLAIAGVDQPEFWLATLAGLEAPSLDSRPLALHQLLHTTAAETGARVAISGLAAHILLGSQTSTFSEQATISSEPLDILAQYRRMLAMEPVRDVASIWSQEARAVLQQEESWEETLQARKLARRATQFADKQQACYYLDLHLRLPDLVVGPAQQLATQERMVVRSPYLNTHVMDLLTHLPAILVDGTPKHELVSLLAQRSLDPLPAATFPLAAPMTSLLHVDASELVQQVLSTEAIRATGVFEPRAVEVLLKHDEKTVPRELLMVFTTQLLCQLFGVG